MKTTLVLSLTGLLTLPAWAADVTAQLKAAAANLAQQANYSWTVTTTTPQRPAAEGTDGQAATGVPGGQGGPGIRAAAGETGTPGAPAGPGGGENAGGERRGGPGGFGGPGGGPGGPGGFGGRGGPGGRGGGGGFGGFGGAPDGKTERAGLTVFTYKMGDNVTEVAVKGEKVAIKEADGWKTADQMNDGGDNGGGGGFGRGNRNQFMLRRAQQAKLPVVEVQELLDRVKDLKWDRDGFVGQLSPEALRQTFSPRGGRGGGDGGDRPGPDLSNIKGSVKFWARSGMIWKYETRIEGKMSFGRDGREFDISRTTLVEVKDIGSTRLNVPVEIRRKLTTG